ncbi:hypothetical protein [Shimia haliotis]|uniref:Translocase n=1 Tax=Shimia haliotis TaxID=1280847 RepID=A0A1I4EKF5_9RHOB|nr:hypothetical protein [Shimia haliotis]SFL06205.1 hypothetical protein SAMN04488036_104348 [Shimia haliotis]
MRNLRNVYRRYSMACATATIAIFIGFVMERTEASQAPVSSQHDLSSEPSLPVVKASLSSGVLSSPKHAAGVALPNMPTDRSSEVSLPGGPVLVAVADDLPVGLIPEEEVAPAMGCDVTLEAESTAGAMVRLVMTAPCHTGARVSVHHGNMTFTEIVGDDGFLELVVPALAVNAVFAVMMPNGDGATASATVDSLEFYDRTVIHWIGQSGVELHAREFGAAYGEDGHVWREEARDISVLIGGLGGFLTPLGSADLPDAARAEVYTFPSLTTSQSGKISLSVEAEITEANCGRSIAVQAEKIEAGKVASSRALQMEIPSCDAVGQFLVLKNLVEDLTIAQK